MSQRQTDFHHNIFYYYGRSNSTYNPRDAKIRETQLENNTTKALVNTLTYCSDSVKEEFFKRLGLKWKAPSNFMLQTKIVDGSYLGPDTKKLLLGIVPPWINTQDKEPTYEPNESESIPDAWLLCKNCSVLVESKIAGFLNQKQIESHLKLLHANTEVFKQVTWEQIYKIFSRLVVESDVDQFLIHQFCEYLEFIEMAGFVGFKPEYFEYLRSKKFDYEMKDTIRKAMQTLRLQLKERIGKKYPKSRVGNFQEDICWAAFSNAEKHQDVAHVTVEIWPEWFEVFANVETQKPIMILKNNIKNKPKELVKILKKLQAEYIVTITSRVYIARRKYDYQNQMELSIADLFPNGRTSKEKIDSMKELLSRIKYPQFSIRRRYPQEYVISRGKEFISDILDAINNLDEFVNFANLKIKR